MSFLDDIISPVFGQASETTTRRLNMMISTALISSEEKLKYEMESWKYTEDEARELCNKLEQYMPIMGLHSWPLDVKQIGEAIKYQVAKDDLHEMRFKK